MLEAKASKTAAFMAAFRARATADEPAYCSDRWARFFGERRADATGHELERYPRCARETVVVGVVNRGRDDPHFMTACHKLGPSASNGRRPP
jgi:hypothetical protein